MSSEAWIHRVWAGRGLVSTLLLPLSWLFGVITATRRLAYRRGWKQAERVGVPVVIVGNISVGGVGKTPLVIDLVERLQVMGQTPGVVARGYGAQIGPAPLQVTPGSRAQDVGDEPLLIARRTGAVVVVHPDRVAAARRAVALGATVIVADDGLQHLRLARDVEIVVIDGDRGVGNGRLLPAGPLREPVRRLRAANLTVVRGQARPEIAPDAIVMTLAAGALRRVSNEVEVGSLDDFANQQRGPVHAVAGIGHPGRFFDTLRAAGLDVIAHPLPDHAALTADQLPPRDAVLLMTEKDAVKCGALAGERWFYLPVGAAFSDAESARLAAMLRKCVNERRGRSGGTPGFPPQPVLDSDRGRE